MSIPAERLRHLADTKRGGTRTTGLFRTCRRCGKRQEGVEVDRRIEWIDLDSNRLL